MDQGLTAADREREGTTSVDTLLRSLSGSLGELRQQLDIDPFANPIKLLSLELLGRLRRGALDDAAIEGLVQRLTRQAFQSRAALLRSYVGETDAAANETRIVELLRAQAEDGAGGRVDFPTFDGRLNRIVYGIVFTAHPTFGQTPELMQLLTSLAFDREAEPSVLAEVERLPHRPAPRLDIDLEHDLSMRVIDNVRSAVRRVAGLALDVARELYPGDWRHLRPRLVGLASWVGYDTDGRSDITWTTTYGKRLLLQIDQLMSYRESVRRLRAGAGDEPPLAALLELLEARLSLAVKTAEDDDAVLAATGPQDAAWQERLARASRAMSQDRAGRLNDGGRVVELVERALAATADDATARGLCILRAELLTQGLTAARTHVRINAVQLHNAVRKTIGMDHAADDPAHRQTYLRDVAALAAEAVPTTVNFGSVHLERATAKRVFMTMVQMLKHLDAGEPLRFLIAECDTAFTLVTALLFARQFGIAERIDISPLFETRKALERGPSIIAEALAVPAYRDYVQARGRLCIQTGFSDAGRYMGQTAASVAIERIRLGLVGILEAEGLTGIEVVVFDTHGESIGRGAHPGSFADRLRYYDTPESRRRFSAAGIALREESSFQGGDGFLMFFDPEAAFAVVTRILEHCLGPVDPDPDPFYAQAGYVEEFFAAVTLFNTTIIDNPNYATFLGAWGTNLLYPTGSRSLKRQERGAQPKIDLTHPSQLRAIPHNSILQQLGVLANTIGGVGQAIAKDPDRFKALYRDSDRFRRLVAMVEHAFKFTDLDVAKAYVDLFDPEPWLRLARIAADEAGQEEIRLVADVLERIDIEDRLARIFRIFHRDYMDLARAFQQHRRAARKSGARPIVVDPAVRDTLHLLHAIRLALIQRLMLRAVHVPDFSDRHALSHDTVLVRLMHLDVEPALQVLGEIFPVEESQAVELDWGEPATYGGSDGQSYVTEHRTIFRPLADDYDLIRRIGSAVALQVGAVG